MENTEQKALFDAEYTVPVETPSKDDGTPVELSKVIPVGVFHGHAATEFKKAIEYVDEVEDGLVRYPIEYPKVPNRYVLANKSLNPERPAFLAIVSNKYRVIRSREVLSVLHDAFDGLDGKENWDVLVKVASSVFVKLSNRKNPRQVVVYSNSYDRSIRESIVLPGLISMKYTHTRRGTKKHGIKDALSSALDISSVDARYEVLDKYTISKRAILRFVLNTMSMTRRSIVRKFFKHTLELAPGESESDDAYEAMFFELYFGKYGKTLGGFARFVYDVYDYFAKEGKITKSLLVLQSGTSVVKSALSVNS